MQRDLPKFHHFSRAIETISFREVGYLLGGHMTLSSRILRSVASSFLILALSTLTLADTVRLKDGSIIKGKIVSFGGGKFIVVIGDGSRHKELTFGAAEVESIQFDPAAPTQPSDPSNRNASYKEPVQTPPVVIPVKDSRNETSANSNPQTSPTGGSLKPIEWQIKVLADSTANGWTNSGWVVKKGQRIRITGDGKISLGKGQSSPASGLPSLNDDQKLLKNVATGALIAVIGDDNNEFIYIGSEREFTATRDGALFLGINESNLDDNSGAFNVKVEIFPEGGI